jgi:hypothetical protein
LGARKKTNKATPQRDRRTRRAADPTACADRAGPKQKPRPPETNPLEYLPVILNRCFPGFWEHVDALPDFRDPARIHYSVRHLLGLGLLINARRLEDYRLDGEYLIAVDGTEQHRFKDRDRPHCPQCLKQTHSNGTTDYFHSVLEAKLVTREGLALSMASEFIENGGREYDKQDCELKAFYRLAPELKRQFPRLAICLLLDSLYANETLLDICVANSWSFYVGFKEGSIPNLYKQMLETMAKHPAQVVRGEDDTEQYTCRWACNLTHKGHRLHAVMCEVKAKKDGKETRLRTGKSLRLPRSGTQELLPSCTDRALPAPADDA